MIKKNADSSKMKIIFYGTRGTYKKTEKEFSKYGTNTPCVVIEKVHNGETFKVIIDSGSGIVRLGQEYIHDNNKKPHDFHIFFTHYHFDHIEGLPFFDPLYLSQNSVHFYGLSHREKNLKEFFEDYINEDTFPIPLNKMGAKKQYHPLSTGEEINIGPLKVMCYHSHPNNHPVHGAMYYKIIDTTTNKSLCCLWDYEKSDDDHGIIEFCKGSDVLIHDTFFTEKEYNSEYKGYGHCHYLHAIENALEANIKESLICFHYNIRHNDKKIDKIKETLPKVKEFNIIFPTEGFEYTV